MAGRHGTSTSLLVIAFACLATTTVLRSQQTATPPATCVPSTVRVGNATQPVAPGQDVKFGECLFTSTTAFNQVNPASLFASCNGCHPGNQRDQSAHPVLIPSASGNVAQVRQAPNLRNVNFNVPLGWDGRHGGVLGDPASIAAAIEDAAAGAINSPVEMAGHVDPTVPSDKAKLDALAAFLMSRSPTTPTQDNQPPPEALDSAVLAHIKTGADVFFGRSASTAGLLAQGKACISCHPLPFFTDNKIRTNVLNPDAAYDFGFVHSDGSVGPIDPGAGLVTVTDSATGRSVQVGTFKTPSLHRFYPLGEPAFHGGNFGRDERLFHFYEKSLGFTLAPGESTGLTYWLIHCPRGPERDPSTIPVECGIPAPNPAMSVDLPLANSTVTQPFRVAGWAADLASTAGPGVDAIDVWAYPVVNGSLGAPEFVGEATLGLSRPDVGKVFGPGFNNAGFNLFVNGMSPGTYQLVVFARSVVAGTFNQARVVQISVQ